MYFGSARDAESYFAGLGYICPHGFNPSDFFLDVLSLDTRSPEGERVTRGRIDAIANEYAKQLLAMRADARISVQLSSALTHSPVLTRSESQGSKVRIMVEESSKFIYPTSFITQLGHLTVRSFRVL